MITCHRCGEPFEAKNARAKWCSARCRKAVQRGGEVIPLVPPPADPDEPPTVTIAGFELTLGPVGAATFAELQAADRLDTQAGRVALALAARIDSPKGDTGSAMAAVARQLSTAMAEALKGGKQSSTAQMQDELAERRQRHGA